MQIRVFAGIKWLLHLIFLMMALYLIKLFDIAMETFRKPRRSHASSR